MIEINLVEFGILLLLSTVGVGCFIIYVVNEIKEKKFAKQFAKGGFIPLDNGYQPTKPPNTGSNAQPTSFEATHDGCYREYIPCYDNRIFISIETAKKIIEKKKIPKLERQIPQAVMKTEITHHAFDVEEAVLITEVICCPSCGLPLSLLKKKRCTFCHQALDWSDFND